jgi:hypothetical protein
MFNLNIYIKIFQNHHLIPLLKNKWTSKTWILSIAISKVVSQPKRIKTQGKNLKLKAKPIMKMELKLSHKSLKTWERAKYKKGKVKVKEIFKVKRRQGNLGTRVSTNLLKARRRFMMLIFQREAKSKKELKVVENRSFHSLLYFLRCLLLLMMIWLSRKFKPL